MGGSSVSECYTEIDRDSGLSLEEPADVNIGYASLRWLKSIRDILDGLGRKHGCRKPGHTFRNLGNYSRFIGLENVAPLRGVAGECMMPPTPTRQTTDMLLGQIQSSVENLAERLTEERDESKERGRKIDALLANFSAMDLKINTIVNDVENKWRDQARLAALLDTRLTNVTEDVKKHTAFFDQVNNSLTLINTNLRSVEVEQRLTGVTLDIIQKDQNELRTNVTSIKKDTETLQKPVAQFVELRRRVLSTVFFLVSVITVLWWSFVHGIGELITNHVSKFFGKD
jgi:septal ring factor EnvC (AmiA/AmiB activator)